MFYGNDLGSLEEKQRCHLKNNTAKSGSVVCAENEHVFSFCCLLFSPPYLSKSLAGSMKVMCVVLD